MAMLVRLHCQMHESSSKKIVVPAAVSSTPRQPIRVRTLIYSALINNGDFKYLNLGKWGNIGEQVIGIPGTGGGEISPLYRHKPTLISIINTLNYPEHY